MLLSPRDIRNELWKAEFRALFPEIRELIQKYFASPTCGRCFEMVVIEVQKYPDRLKEYFKQDVTFVTQQIKAASEAPVPHDASAVKDLGGLPALPRATRSGPVKLIPLQRIFRLFNPEDVQEELKSYPPSKYSIEAMGQIGDKVSLLLLEFGVSQPYASDAEDPVKKKEAIEKALAEIRGKVSDDLKVKVDVIRAYLLPSPQSSQIVADYYSSQKKEPQ